MSEQHHDPGKVYDVELTDIVVSECNARQTGKNAGISELADSIRQLGLLQPVVLLDAQEPPFDLIVGQRRFLAHRDVLAQEHKRWQSIRAVFQPRRDETALIASSLSENMMRAQLNHADAMSAVTKLYERLGRDDRTVAKATGLSLKRVRQYIDIDAYASEEMKRKLAANEVSVDDVKRALKAAQWNLKKAERLLDMMAEYDLTVHQKKHLVEFGQSHADASPEDILTDAQKPRVERTVLVSLPDALQAALQQAVDELAMAPEEVACQALEDWLSAQGFLMLDSAAGSPAASG